MMQTFSTAPSIAPPTPRATPATARPSTPSPPQPIAARAPSVAPPITAAHRIVPTTRRGARAATPATDDDLTTHALLTIVSEGEIYVDERRVGSSTVTVSILPGRHILASGAGDNATSLTVDLSRGERRRVVLR